MPLPFPEYEFATRLTGSITELWDGVRKCWVVATPEERVRQTLVRYLVDDKKYPAGLTAIERGIKVLNQQRRYDVVVYSRSGQPLLLAECKAPTVKVTQQTFNQVAHYNMVLRVPLLVVTNGRSLFCCAVDFEKQSYSFLNEIPAFGEVGG